MRKVICDLAGNVCEAYLTGGTIGVVCVLLAAGIGAIVALIDRR